MLGRLSFLLPLSITASICSIALADPSIEEHLASKDRLVSDGQYDQALEILSHVEADHLKDTKKARHNLDVQRCALLRAVHRPSEAEDACGRAIQIVEEEESKEIDDRDYSSKWRRYLEKRAWFAYNLRSSIREDMGRFDEAEADELRMFQLFDDNPDVLNNVGYVWTERGANLPCAVDMLEDAVEAEPENPVYLDSLGWAYFRSGDVERAAVVIDQSITAFGSEPSSGLAETLMNRGDIFWHGGEQDKARAAWQQASDTLNECGCKPDGLISDLAGRIGQSDPDVTHPVAEKDDRDLAIMGIFTSSYHNIVNLIGGGMMPSKGFQDYVFFDNGEAFRGVGSPLSLLTSSCMKKIHPNKWTTWRREGDRYVVEKANGKQQEMDWQQMPAPKDHSAIIGKTYHAESVTTAGGVFDNGISVVGSRTLTFLDAETYTLGKFVGVTGNAVTAYRNENPSEFGTYEINEFSIRLTPDKGAPQEKLFYFGKEADDTIDYGLMKIGGHTYLLRD